MFEKKSFKLKKTDTSVPCEVTLEVVIPKEAIENHREKTLASLNEQIKIDGFRPGHVPEKVLIEKVGDYAITEEACRKVIDDVFAEIVLESKQVPINQPTIQVIKLAAGTDAEIKITFATPPVIELANYKKISAKHNENKTVAAVATDVEVEAMIMDLRKQVAHMEHHVTHAEHDHSHGELEPVALDDAFASKVGPFKTVDELKIAVQNNINEGKKQKELEKYRIALIDEVITESKISYPSFFLTSELNIMIEELKADLTRMGATLESYLKQIDKTDEDIRNEKKEVADKRVKTQLALSKIAVTEGLKPNENVVSEQVKEIMKQHSKADPENVKAFVERFELNQLVWKFLEESK